MKKLAFLGGAVGLGLGALIVWNAPTHAADHLDAPAVTTNPMADITDVYAWMDSSGSKVNLIMDVSPGDPGTGSAATARHFGPSILYVFHVTSVAAFGAATGTETKVICKFDSDTSAQCWVGSAGYVKGDPSAVAGVASTDGKVKLFAGRRSDPFFFNFNGFVDAVTAVDTAEGSNGSALDALKDASGCLNNAGVEVSTLEPTAAAIRTKLQEGAQGAAGHAPCDGAAGADADCFKSFDVQSIVLQIDKSLLNVNTNTVVGVWASTNAAN